MVSQQDDSGSGSTDAGRAKDGGKINARRLLRFRDRNEWAIQWGDRAGLVNAGAARRRHKNRTDRNDGEDSDALGARLEREIRARTMAKP